MKDIEKNKKSIIELVMSGYEVKEIDKLPLWFRAAMRGQTISEYLADKWSAVMSAKIKGI